MVDLTLHTFLPVKKEMWKFHFYFTSFSYFLFIPAFLKLSDSVTPLESFWWLINNIMFPISLTWKNSRLTSDFRFLLVWHQGVSLLETHQLSYWTHLVTYLPACFILPYYFELLKKSFFPVGCNLCLFNINWFRDIWKISRPPLWKTLVYTYTDWLNYFLKETHG